MYFVQPRELERHALRTLLLYRKGATSFLDLKTVDGILCESYREAAQKLGYLKDDNEWNIALSEAALTVTNIDSLRDLFSIILIHCQPANPNFLWDNHKNSMCQDMMFKYKNRFSINEYHQYCLFLIDEKVF